jgi:hypothetical protein
LNVPPGATRFLIVTGGKHFTGNFLMTVQHACHKGDVMRVGSNDGDEVDAD